MSIEHEDEVMTDKRWICTFSPLASKATPIRSLYMARAYNEFPDAFGRLLSSVNVLPPSTARCGECNKRERGQNI
jgi:hypothetical protein